MQIHIENIINKPIVYMRHIGKYGEQNFFLMEKMKKWIEDNKLWNNSGTIYGIAQDDQAVTPADECRYDVCFVTAQKFKDDDIYYATLIPGKYLVFKIPHTTNDVQHFWNSVINAVLEENEQIDENRPILERYQFSFVQEGYCEFCVPII